MRWTVITDLIDDWIDSLDTKTVRGVIAAFEALEMKGPALGRPLVDHVKGSRLRNLKELRPASSRDSEVRILFVFDESRQAIMLLAGDKAGRFARGPKWARWYKRAIPEAEQRYDLYRHSHQKGAR